jgi:hypothetical protein
MEEIINKVTSALYSILNFIKGCSCQIDISQWLLEGFAERKDFETSQNHWTQYQDQFVAINCSTGAIVPAWASI